MDCVVDARLDFVFLRALVKRVGGWRGPTKVEASSLSVYTLRPFVKQRLKTDTSFITAPIPVTPSRQIVIEVTVTFLSYTQRCLFRISPQDSGYTLAPRVPEHHWQLWL